MIEPQKWLIEHQRQPHAMPATRSHQRQTQTQIHLIVLGRRQRFNSDRSPGPIHDMRPASLRSKLQPHQFAVAQLGQKVRRPPSAIALARSNSKRPATRRLLELRLQLRQLPLQLLNLSCREHRRPLALDRVSPRPQFAKLRFDSRQPLVQSGPRMLQFGSSHCQIVFCRGDPSHSALLMLVRMIMTTERSRVRRCRLPNPTWPRASPQCLSLIEQMF